VRVYNSSGDVARVLFGRYVLSSVVHTFSFGFIVTVLAIASVAANPKETLAATHGGGWQDIVASHYAHKFHGRTTANCERFDMYGLTAASKTLRFGTRVRIRNPKNGKEVVVRITDRGPYVEGRNIDLSLGAATKLGVVATGVARLQMQIVSVPAKKQMGNQCT
jgi:rare lipoprotein A